LDALPSCIVGVQTSSLYRIARCRFDPKHYCQNISPQTSHFFWGTPEDGVHADKTARRGHLSPSSGAQGRDWDDYLPHLNANHHHTCYDLDGALDGSPSWLHRPLDPPVGLFLSSRSYSTQTIAGADVALSDGVPLTTKDRSPTCTSSILFSRGTVRNLFDFIPFTRFSSR
jgi:hypothetical protein